MVSDPAAETPLSALALAFVRERAGLPTGVSNAILSTDPAEVSKKCMRTNKVRRLTGTGSTNLGKILIRQGADQIIMLGLELGRNAHPT